MTNSTDAILIDIPIEPVPASRPRVTRWGAYYGKKYQQFKNRVDEMLPDLYAGEPLSGPLAAIVIFYCKRAKTTKRTWPRGDVDNYAKALLDAGNGSLYGDDDQIVHLTVSKLYASLEPPRISIYLTSWGEQA